jgi:hypothetical protein
MKKQIIELLKISDVSYYRWKKERKIFELLEKYFSDNDLKEFLSTGKITRLELCKEAEEENYYADLQYLHIFLDQDKASRFAKSSDYGYDFYFSMLLKIKNMLGDEPLPFINVYEYAWMILYKSVSDPSSFSKNEIVPIFSEFGCGANKALKMNLYHDFEPMVKMAMQDHFNKEEKKEAYIHALSYNLYSLYSEKSFTEKKHLLKSILYTLFPTEVKEIPNGVFLNPFIEENIELIEKNYDTIIKSLRETKDQK